MRERIRTIGQFAIRIALTGAVLGVIAVSQPASAQRVLLFEDFENATPDPPMPDVCASGELPEGVTLAEACIGAESVDTYNRSRVQDETDSLATITGASFPDPFDPGNNQSLVMHNPYQSTQMAVNFFSIFPDDANDPHYYFRNGVIQFDVWLETPQPESLFTFLGIRFGFEPNPEDRNQVAGDGDETIWNVFNLFGGAVDNPAQRQIAEDILLQRASPNFQDNLYDQGNDEFFLDPNNDVVAPERAMRVRYEIDGDSATYTVSIDNLDDPDDPVEIVWPGGPEQPWKKTFNFVTFQFEPAPGINEISFMTDASGFAVTDVSQNVYIDNLLIIDNDQEPLPSVSADFDQDGDVDGDDFLLWQGGFPTASGAAKMDGDFDNDGDVDGDDFLGWQAEFGTAAGSGAAVPEPATLVLALGSVILLTRRRTLAFRS